MSQFAKLFRTTEEQIIPVQATVSGHIPDWLQGSLLRVGPGVFDLDSGFTMNHFMDGYSVLFKFSIKNKKVEFSKRYLQSDSFKNAQKNGKPVRGEVGTRSYPDPTRGFLSNVIAYMMPALEITDNCNSNIIKLGKDYLALTQTSSFRVVNTQDLSTGDLVDIFKDIGAIFISPIVLKDRDDVHYTVALNTALKQEEYLFVKFRNDFQDDTRAQVFCRLKPTNELSMSIQHSFGLTENYLVFIEQPYRLQRIDLASTGVKGSSTFCENFYWKPETKNRFFIINKSSGVIMPAVYQSKEPFFFLHVVNAYEENRKIIIDIIAHDSPEIFQQTFLRHLRNGKFKMNHQVQTKRYILPVMDMGMDSSQVSSDLKNQMKSSNQGETSKSDRVIEVDHEMICPHPHELPTLNMKYSGCKYRYYYASGFLFSGEFAFSVIKVDVKTKTVTKWFAGNGQVPSEPIFVKKPNAASEDDGVLLVCISTSDPKDRDRLVILDASTMQLIESAFSSCHIPISCHGLFIEKDC